MSSTVLSFRRKRGISLATLHWEKASSHVEENPMAFTEAFQQVSACSRVVRRTSEGRVCIVSGKSGLISSCDCHLGIPLKSSQGKLASSRLVSRKLVFLSSGDRDLAVAFEVHLGSQVSLELSKELLLSSRFLTGVSWEPLCDLKGIHSSIEFERELRVAL